MTTLVSPEDVSQLLNRELTDAERVRVQMDIDAIVAELELWTRRKFEPTTIYNEKHILVGAPQHIFLRWGDPDGDVLVRYMSSTATARTFDGETWGTDLYEAYGYYHTHLPVFVTYTVDTSLVDEYADAIKRLVVNQVMKSLLQADVARYGVIQGYSVEGLSIQWGGQGVAAGGSAAQGWGRFSAADLSGIAPLKRRLIA
jgi:hypothetical protein